MTSRKKLSLALPAMLMFIIGDYLLGINSIGVSVFSDMPYGLYF